MKKLAKQLFKLLSIHSPSGKEWGVAKYLLPILKGNMDHVSVDSFGNIYAEKVFGPSNYTVLLNSHMDTVASYPPIPKWRKNKTEIFNADGRGALGGDDKCGIAAHLAVIRQLNRGTKFNGTLKVLFTRQEEVGCVGAGEAVNLKRAWFKDIDAAIVVDRKGSDHIITGGWSENFCHENFTQFWQDMAGLTGFKGFPQDGTISDTMIFAELGINSVNLSAGYYNAHTKDEFIKIDELKRTALWIINAFDNIEAYGKFPSFKYDKPESMTWGGWNYNWKNATTNTASYCDGCATVCESDELYEDPESGYVLCPDCMDAQTFDTCECCMNDFSLDALIEVRGHVLCVHCAAYLDDTEVNQEVAK